MFEKAIEIIMAEPTELRYPAYYADLLRKADVPDTNDGDTISRKDAIDALSVGKEALNRVLDEMDIVGTDREKYSWGLGLIESAIKDIEALPSAQPETSILTVTVNPDSEEIERVARKIKDAPVMVLPSTYSDVDMALKLNKAYDDGYETGYLQGKYDWIAKKKGRWNFIGNQMFECTECGVCYTQSQFNQMRVRITDSISPNFCPSCGADMREVTE